MGMFYVIKCATKQVPLHKHVFPFQLPFRLWHLIDFVIPFFLVVLELFVPYTMKLLVKTRMKSLQRGAFQTLE